MIRRMSAFRLGAARRRAPTPPVPVILGPGPVAGAGSVAGGAVTGAAAGAGGVEGCGSVAAATLPGSPSHSAEDQPERERHWTWNQTMPSSLVAGPPMTATVVPWGR